MSAYAHPATVPPSAIVAPAKQIKPPKPAKSAPSWQWLQRPSAGRGYLQIGDTAYQISEQEFTYENNMGGRLWDVMKHDGTTYRITENHEGTLACDCPDSCYRGELRGGRYDQCKHARAIIAAYKALDDANAIGCGDEQPAYSGAAHDVASAIRAAKVEGRLNDLIETVRGERKTPASKPAAAVELVPLGVCPDAQDILRRSEELLAQAREEGLLSAKPEAPADWPMLSVRIVGAMDKHVLRQNPDFAEWMHVRPHGWEPDVSQFGAEAIIDDDAYFGDRCAYMALSFERESKPEGGDQFEVAPRLLRWIGCNGKDLGPVTVAAAPAPVEPWLPVVEIYHHRTVTVAAAPAPVEPAACLDVICIDDNGRELFESMSREALIDAAVNLSADAARLRRELDDATGFIR